MPTGLFHGPSVHGPCPGYMPKNRRGAANLAKARASRTAERRIRMATFADLISDEVSITQAAAAIGLSRPAGSAMFSEMRAELGWQAA